ncbi:MAG: EpsG family protein [Liquorilactobacillus hordei]
MAIVILMTEITSYAMNVRKKFTSNILIIAVIVISSAVVAFRGITGTDSAMYITLYEDGANSIFRWNQIENGFLLFMKLVRNLGGSYQLFFFLVSSLTTGFILMTIAHEKKIINVRIAAVIYFTDLYFNSFNIMRQSLAISICLYALIIFFDRKKITGILLILLAAQIHYSAYVCLLVILGDFLFNNRNTRTNILMMFTLFIGILFLISHRLLLGNIVQLVTGNQYYAGYITRDDYTGGSFLIYYLKIFPILSIPFLYLRYYKNHAYMNVLFVLMICGYIMSSLGAVLATQVGRIGMYFTTLSIVMLGFCCNNDIYIGNKIVVKKDIVSFCVYSFYILMFIINVFVSKYYEIVPYRPFTEFFL